MTITRVAVLIRDGIPLLGALPHDILLRHVRTRQYKGGIGAQRIRGGANDRMIMTSGHSRTVSFQCAAWAAFSAGAGRVI